ncbi:hypothetical protein ACFVDI_04535 [Nocardioides sp. NPDC057767]
MLRNAGIWIVDEPTSAIDAEGEREVFAELLANPEDPDHHRRHSHRA